MSGIERLTKLPRLLNLDKSPSMARRRWYWRYVNRWRRRLFYLWRQEVAGESDRAEIARSVDDLMTVALLLDYVRRSSWQRRFVLEPKLTLNPRTDALNSWLPSIASYPA